MEQATLRIIDANLNRIGEGLRVLEELARFSLNYTELSQKLKNLRHDIVRVSPEMQARLLMARDSDGDVGAYMMVAGEGLIRNNKGMVMANAGRAEEALRVLEEIARLPESGLDTEKFKKARFALYSIEKELIAKIGRHDKLKKLTGLYVIIDSAFMQGRDYGEVTKKIIRNGAKVIQLRGKRENKKTLFKTAKAVKQICEDNDVLFIVNDHLDIALAVEADGLHIGEEDLPVDITRHLLPPDRILGCSAKTVDDAKTAIDLGADHLGVGAMFATGTKDGAEVVGKERLKEIREAVDVPIVAIGGINQENAGEIINAGADTVAVISAVLGADDIEEATRQLVKIIEGGEHG